MNTRKEPDLTTYSGRLSARMRGLREKVGLTQEAVSLLLGRPQNTYSTWENGTTRLPLEYVPAIAKIFKLKHARLLFPED